MPYFFFLVIALLSSSWLAGCADEEGALIYKAGSDSIEPLDPDTIVPCSHRQYWPFTIRSRDLPIMVHYRSLSENETAEEVLNWAETGWRFHVDTLGFRPPLDDTGFCGDDGSFDVFVWKGRESCFVSSKFLNAEGERIKGENLATSWDDRVTYMVMDPWGSYGGDKLEETVVHESGHGSQAAADWFESPIFFEMTSVFLDMVYADAYTDQMVDFQKHPDWSLDRNDDYETYYMYGSALYLKYLQDRYFEGDARFVPAIWWAARNAPGAEEDPTKNEPDFEDVLDGMLRNRAGVSFLDTVLEFARWRWYTGDHIDDRHFRHFRSGLENLRKAKLTVAARVDTSPKRFAVDSPPMMLGSNYIDVVSAGGASQVTVSLVDPSPNARFVVQAVPGLEPDSDGEFLDLSSGPKTLRLDAEGKRTLIVVALPNGDDDPDARPNTVYPYSLAFGP